MWNIVMNTLKWLRLPASIAAGILSLVRVAIQGFELDMAAPLKSLLPSYEVFLEVLLGWMEPFLQSGLKSLLQVLPGWMQSFLQDAQLHTHWKHFFVLMFLYIAATARVNFERGRPDSAKFTYIWGAPIALASSVGSGSVELNHPIMLPVIFPIFGFFVYQTGQAVWDAIRYTHEGNKLRTFLYFFIRFALTDLGLGVGAMLLVGFLANMAGWPNPTLIALAIFMILLALRTIGVAARAAYRDRKKHRPGANGSDNWVVFASVSKFLECFLVQH